VGTPNLDAIPQPKIPMTHVTIEIPETIRKYVKEVIPRMNGWCEPDEALVYVKYILERKPTTGIEIGVYAGRSFVAMALAMEHLGHGKMIGIDPWSKEASIAGYEGPAEDDQKNKKFWNDLNHDAIMDECQSVIKQMKVEHRCELIRATSDDAIKGIRDRNLTVDLLSIDGNHSVRQSCDDVRNYVPLVAKGGVIFFDDIDWDTTQSAIRLLVETCKLKEVVDNCGIFIKQ
jgi:predicted O-methyltransferase YrrM